MSTIKLIIGKYKITIEGDISVESGPTPIPITPEETPPELKALYKMRAEDFFSRLRSLTLIVREVNKITDGSFTDTMIQRWLTFLVSEGKLQEKKRFGRVFYFK